MYLKIIFDRQEDQKMLLLLLLIHLIHIFHIFDFLTLSYMIKLFACHLNQCDYAQNNLIIFEMYVRNIFIIIM